MLQHRLPSTPCTTLDYVQNYEVSVRGYTSVGPGPKSTINILTSRELKYSGEICKPVL